MGDKIASDLVLKVSIAFEGPIAIEWVDCSASQETCYCPWLSEVLLRGCLTHSY